MGRNMRRIASVAILALVTAFAISPGALGPAWAQGGPPTTTTTTPLTTVTTNGIPPLGWVVMGTVACSAAAPIVGTIVLGREMTAAEVVRSTVGCFLGPVGWISDPLCFQMCR